ncbi:hypothetical protein [Nocardia sp. BMG111209]|uniref:hypothetical protein n=1 Tax=Nocardia sp. BMG111209 TaxID=1160137 RepID=UPI00035FCF6A|nr:hypothetical protein [Nocardia sp. BMG111209]
MPTTRHRTRFLDHRIPALYAGDYRLTVEQDIATVAALQTRHQRFGVRGPRFTLGDSEVQACYPVPGAAGKYSQILPHVTLGTAGLPWARLPVGEDDGTPWIFLLVMRAGELPDDPDAVGEVTVSTVVQLLDGRAGPGQPPQIDPATLMDGEAEMACRTVGIPKALFDAIRPSFADAALLAHIREGGRPDADHVLRRGEPEPEPDLDECNAVIVGNRFPAATATRHVAHLVSAEGFGDYLRGAAVPAQGLRMVSLHAWSFETLDDDGIGFGDLVANLAAPPDLALRSPIVPGELEEDVRQRLRGGATVVPQRLESGERSLAFYRGPFTAEPARPLPPTDRPRLESSGEALVYLEQWGVYDSGYASAFSLGRALALGDAPFRNRLLEFRKEGRRAVRRVAAHPELVAGRTVAGAGQVLRANRVRTAFDHLLESRLPRALARTGTDLATAPRRPAARAARVGGTLSMLSSEGLRATVSGPHTQAVLRAVLREKLDPVQQWLNRLAVLEMVPFDHLVPDPRMLPPESIRFFYIDPGWVRAAVDGALSVGVGHALDSDLNELAAALPDLPACGVLIRSILVPQWPRTLYSAFHGEEQMQPLRTATFGSNVLMLLYPGTLDTFTIAEPPQGLHFGVGDLGTIDLRALDGVVGEYLREFPDPPGFGRFLRSSHDVLDVAGTLLPALAAEHRISALSPAQFALQMLKAPQLQTFDRS